MQNKIVIPVLVVSVLSGVATYWYFSGLYRETETNALVSKARAVVLSAESAREYTADQIRYDVFKNAQQSNMSVDQVLRTVPIFSAMTVAKKKATELGFTLKVPKFSPRNPDNQPDEYEAAVLRKLESGAVAESWEVHKASNAIRYFRPIKLTEECMRCHGDASRSGEYWGRSDGKDITGTKMENWRVGEVHGAFEVTMSMQPIDEAATQKSIIIAGISALSVGAILFIVIFIVRMVTRPLQTMAVSVEKIANGDFSPHFSSDSNDEIGVLANSFSQVVHTLNAFISAQDEMARQHNAGMISYRIPSQQFNGTYAQMAQGINDLVAAHIAVKMRVVDVISQYAIGNFSVDMDRLPGEKAKITASIDDVKASLQAINNEIIMLSTAAVDGRLSVRGDASKFQYTFREIVEGINNTLDAITKPLVATAEYVDSFSKGAQQVSSASQSLSQGATEQAASLEEISSSMQEIASQTKLNAENANQANQLAMVSRDSAERGSSDMSELITAMNEINESSKNISRIIKVIDEIAFQTNLLALNAAVEAARAGRHGKGFAVVAEEVRNLAARSAKAAKETAEMIENAVRKADNGSQIAQRTANGLKEIVDGSGKVTDIVAEIAAASNEQAQGISQINVGLGQIDKVTQQNTANAEESAAAAQELSGQAGTLNSMLARFELKDTHRVGGGARNSSALAHNASHSSHTSHTSHTSHNSNGTHNGNGHGHGQASTTSIGYSTGAVRSLAPHEVINLDDDFGKY